MRDRASRELTRSVRTRAATRRHARRAAARRPPAPVAGGGGVARARDADPRRADFRRRSGGARRVLASCWFDLSRETGRDHLHLDPLHERSRALRSHLAHARGQGAGQSARPTRWCANAAPSRSKRPSSPIWKRRPATDDGRPTATPDERAAGIAAKADARPSGFSPRRLWAYAGARRMELLRDPIRLAFALLGPIAADDHLRLRHLLRRRRAALTRCSTGPLAGEPGLPRELCRLALLRASGRRYRRRRPCEQRLHERRADARHRDSGRLRQSDLLQGRTPEVGGVDRRRHAVSRRDDASGYVEGHHQQYAATLIVAEAPAARRPPVSVQIVTRFRYNQAFESVYAMMPAVMLLLLILSRR